MLVSDKSKVLLCIKSKGEIDTKTISTTINMNENKVGVYVNRLQKDGLIEVAKKILTEKSKKPTYLYRITVSEEIHANNGEYKEAIELLSFMNDMFVNNINLLDPISNFIEENGSKFDKIAEIINKVVKNV